MNMYDFVNFQTEMVKKQAVRVQEHLSPILCRYELQANTRCVVQQALQNCLDCAAEHAEAKKEGEAESV